MKYNVEETFKDDVRALLRVAMSKCSPQEKHEAEFSAMPHFKWSTQVKQGDGRAAPRPVRVGFDADTEVAHWGYGFADG